MVFGVLSSCAQSGIDETIAPTEPVVTVAPTAAPTEASTEPATNPQTEPDHQHSYINTVIDPTCTTNGYTTHECQCGDSYSDSEIAALGHDYGAEIVAPTTSAQGYTLYTCSVCSDSYKDNYTSKLPAATQPEETAPPIIEETQPSEPEEVIPTMPSVTEPTETELPPAETVEPQETMPSIPDETEPPPTVDAGWDPIEIPGHTHTWGAWVEFADVIVDYDVVGRYRICSGCGDMDIDVDY